MSQILVSHIIHLARSLIADPDRWIEGELATTVDSGSCDPWDPQSFAVLPPW